MHITKRYLNILAGISVALIAASCSISTTMDDALDRDAAAAIALREDSKIPTKVANQDLVKVNDDIWLGDKSLIEYEGEPLPAYLEAKDGVTLVSNRPITLYEIGDMLNRTTSLGVRYASDIESEIRSKGQSNKPTEGVVETNDWASPDTMIVSYQGPLSGFLDEVSSRFGIWWKYENKDIYFYKFITKSFVIYSLPSNPKMDSNLGGSSSGEGGNASVSMSSSIEVELWSKFETTIKSMISNGAQLTVSPADGTITVTATPDDIKLVAKFVNEQNERLARQVAISVKILQVSLTDSDNYGLDLAATFNKNDLNLLFTGTTGISSGTAGTLSGHLIKSNWTSDAIVQAISSKNRASLVTSGTVTTLNNKPAPIQVTEKQNYIAEMTKTSNGGTSGSYDISVSTDTVETGFTMNILPRILEHGRMLLMFNMTLSDLLGLDDVKYGQSGEYVQNPHIESRAFSQEVTMTSGESLILTGYEKVKTDTKKSGVGSAENSLFGGEAKADKSRSVIVIILTPVILESPLLPETRMSMN